MVVIDTQAHWYPDELWDAYTRDDSYPRCRRDGTEYQIEILPGRWWTVPENFRNLEMQYNDLKDQGVDYILSSSASFGDVDYLPVDQAIEVARQLNDLRVKAANDYPGFVGLATIPWQDAGAAIEVLDDAVHRCRLKGVLLHSNVAGVPLDSPYLRPVYQRVVELDIPIFLHPARSLMEEEMADYGLEIIVGYMYETSTAVLRLILAGILNDFPDLKLVHPHSGACLPYLAGRIDGSYSKPYAVGEEWDRPPSELMKTTYTDTMCQDPATLAFARDFYPRGHIMFGSDYPYFSPAGSLDFVRANVPARELEAVLDTNARRLLKLDI